MDFSSFFNEDGGFDLESFMAAPNDESSKKVAAKGNKKESSKDATSSAGKGASGKDYEVSLPLTVRARSFNLVLDGSESKKVSEIFGQLYEMGYQEVALSPVSASYDKDANTLYITEPIKPLSGDVGVEVSDSFIISDGMKKMALSSSDFDCESDDITSDMLSERWIQNNQEYDGCGVYVEGDICTPAWSKPVDLKELISLPVDVFKEGELITIDDDGSDMTGAQLISKLFGDDNPVVKCELFSNPDGTTYFISYVAKKPSPVKKKLPEKVTGAAPTKKVEQKYQLPLNARIGNFNADISLTADLFDGKEKVTLKEIKTVLGRMYSVFKDTTRKIDVMYIKEENFLSIMLISGTKGAAANEDSTEHFGEFKLLRTVNELTEALKLPEFHGCYVNYSADLPYHGSFRVENLIHGIFLAKENSETGRAISLHYARKLPLIDRQFLDAIITLFRKDLTKESMIMVCYNTVSKEYLLVQPEVDATKVTVDYRLPELLHSSSIIQVLQIHSHNTMPAFFSDTDNRDESMPLVYGVIGKLDMVQPEIRLRAGFNGAFQTLSLEEVFE